ncbi:MAG: hypothetical protein DRJ60_00070 [Thermoprotei archaeon]|nr:MAG: hypothetical protein DRJ60_00070 [Thermoprotei archaeon]
MLKISIVELPVKISCCLCGKFSRNMIRVECQLNELHSIVNHICLPCAFKLREYIEEKLNIEYFKFEYQKQFKVDKLKSSYCKWKGIKNG